MKAKGLGPRQQSITRRTTVTKQVKPKVKRGVGTNLHRIYKWFGQDYRPGCGCEDLERRMNEWGPEGCRKNMEVILKSIHKESSKRGIPFIKTIHRRLVGMAIKMEEYRLAKK